MKTQRDRLIWKKYCLYDKDQKLLEIVKDQKYPTQYRILWVDGTLSADFYNLTRAKENAINHSVESLNSSTAGRVVAAPQE
jgi:hypothetical protein